MSGRLAEFREFRERMNDSILLACSTVLRRDDGITYHVIRCREEGVTDAELNEAFSIALVVGGSIVIPHLRRAVDLLEELPAAGEGIGQA